MSISGNTVNPFEKRKGTVCVCILKLARMVQSFFKYFTCTSSLFAEYSVCLPFYFSFRLTND